jgi:uncharacterized protein YqhQ
MQATRKLIQIIRFALAGVVVMYLFIIVRIPSTTKPNLALLRGVGFLAVLDVILVFVMRRILVFPAEAVLQNQPQDAKALARWKAGYIVTYALSMSIALYGLVLHFFGFSLGQVVPLLLASFALFVFLGPKAMAGEESPSAPIVPR